MEGRKQEAAKKFTTTPHQQYTLAELKKMKATAFLVLLSQQGRVFNKRTRNQVLINAYLGGTSNTPRDKCKKPKKQNKNFDKIIIWKKNPAV